MGLKGKGLGRAGRAAVRRVGGRGRRRGRASAGTSTTKGNIILYPKIGESKEGLRPELICTFESSFCCGLLILSCHVFLRRGKGSISK